MSFGNLLGAIVGAQLSYGGQMFADSQSASNIAGTQTTVSQAWMGPSVTISGSGDHSDWIDWSSGQPLPKSTDSQGNTMYYTTQQMLAVIQWIASQEQGQSDQQTLQKMEAARSTWSNLLNAMGNYSDLQKSPLNTMAQGESSEINNTQSAISGSASLGGIVADLDGTTSQLVTGF